MPAAPVTVRFPSGSDHAEWLRMRTLLWPDCPEEDHRREMCGYAGGGGRAAAFVAEDGSGTLCGFAEAALREIAEGCDSRPAGYLEGIYVLPEFRARGIGRALAAAAERWAASRGCTEMASDCLHDNEAGIRFHRGIGYGITEQLIHFRRRIGREEQGE